MATVQQLIATNLDTALKAISIANGYSFNISGKVYEWKATDVQLADLPCVIWRDYTVEWHEDDQQMKTIRFELVLVATGSTGPATIRQMIEDILKAFFTLENKAVFNPTRIAGCFLQSVDIAVEQGERKTTAAKLMCNVEYLTELELI